MKLAASKNGSDMFLQIFSWLSTDYILLYSGRQLFIITAVRTSNPTNLMLLFYAIHILIAVLHILTQLMASVTRAQHLNAFNIL
jgi:hypothetical protein